ncbi:MAG TPA: alpha/beta fold hydrolase [Longimicrobium sp.]|jgi:pimeloyl-ACP methyl ester carboxylesterase|uniref:alpha/beta hydrolase family protein n=1 Tax=Longimicrobium sp. TaxID=2029185 RepID=UPI002ED7F1FD
MNGHLYLPAGPGPHPAVVLLHGFPGNERSLDLAQALRRAGIGVLFFHYRGAWGSGGLFSWRNAADDVTAALAFLRAPQARERYRVDGGRIVLAGHSTGAWLALWVAAHDAAVCGAVAMGLENLGADGLCYRDDPDERERWLGYLEATVGEGRPIRAESPDALLREQMEHAEAFDLVGVAPALATRPVLMVGGSRDLELPPEEHQHPVADALRAAGSRRVRSVVLRADHSFSGCRLRLVRLVVGWIGDECGF